MYLRLEKQVVELGELMHMAKAPELDRFLAIKLLINSISHDKAKSYVGLGQLSQPLKLHRYI